MFNSLEILSWYSLHSLFSSPCPWTHTALPCPCALERRFQLPLHGTKVHSHLSAIVCLHCHSYTAQTRFVNQPIQIPLYTTEAHHYTLIIPVIYTHLYAWHQHFSWAGNYTNITIALAYNIECNGHCLHLPECLTDRDVLTLAIAVECQSPWGVK